MKGRPNFLKFNVPEINFYIVLIGFLSSILMVYNFIAGSLFFLGFIYIVFHNWKTIKVRKKEWNKHIQNLSLDIDETTKKAILTLPIPLCIIEFDGKISWHNNRFIDITEQKDILGINIDKIVPNLDLRKVLNENNDMYTEVTYKEKRYTIVYNVAKNINEQATKYYMMLYWLDNTDYLNLKDQYEAEKNAITIIQMDGYDDVIKSAPEETRPMITAEVEKNLTILESNTQGALKRTSKDKFILITDVRAIRNLEAEKFSILDNIRKIEFGNSLPVTISMGIGVSGENINENFKNAAGALDLALGRGGDQAVIKTKEKFTFYCGKTKAIEKKNKVKSRLIGHALREIIMQSEKIYIMGHKYPDLDSLGSAVGVFDICKSCNKNAYIVLDKSNESIDSFVRRLNTNSYYEDLFIDREEAIKYCTKDTLLIVVDTHRPNYTECEELLSLTEKRVVIDHHRRGVEFINDTVLLFHEIFVSSTCEMITELVQYIDDDIKINKLTAEGLLAGITLDTKQFTFKTGVRTFEAASYLRKVGADTVEVKKLFNCELRDVVIKSEIISNAKMINENICIAFSKEETNNINVIIAQAADELLNIREIEASFVLAKRDNRILVSARSHGNVNVHVIMEKLGGGGHLDMAGAQLKDVTLQEGYEQVKSRIEEYVEEEI
jgi:c-di-AMP phosphodiesterase-like protein